MINYLIERSELFSTNEINRKLYVVNHILSANYSYEVLEIWAQKYKELLYDFINRECGCLDERRLKSAVNIIHAILNAHAMQYTNVVSPKYDIDNDTLRLCLLAQVEALKNGRK